MSLIKCPECGKDISDESVSCIHCGYPMKQREQQAGTGQIRITRIPTILAGKFRGLPVFIDGKEAAKVHNGETLSLKVDAGEHKIYTKAAWSRSDECIVLIKPNSVITLETGFVISERRMLNPFYFWKGLVEGFSSKPGKAIYLKVIDAGKEHI